MASGPDFAVVYTYDAVQATVCISLGVVAFHANTERFQGLVPLLLHLFPLSVPKGGGGGVGYIPKALEKGYLEHPGSGCCTDDMFENFVRFGRCVC